MGHHYFLVVLSVQSPILDNWFTGGQLSLEASEEEVEDAALHILGDILHADGLHASLLLVPVLHVGASVGPARCQLWPHSGQLRTSSLQTRGHICSSVSAVPGCSAASCSNPAPGFLSPRANNDTKSAVHWTALALQCPDHKTEARTIKGISTVYTVVKIHTLNPLCREDTFYTDIHFIGHKLILQWEQSHFNTELKSLHDRTHYVILVTGGNLEAGCWLLHVLGLCLSFTIT